MAWKLNRFGGVVVGLAAGAAVSLGGCDKKPAETAPKPVTPPSSGAADPLKDAGAAIKDKTAELEKAAAEKIDEAKKAAADKIEEAQKAAADKVDEAKRAAEEAKVKLVSESKAKMEDVKSQITSLQGKVSEADNPVKKVAWERLVAGVEEQYKALEEKFAALRDAPASDAPAATTDFNSILDRVKQAVQAVASQNGG